MPGNEYAAGIEIDQCRQLLEQILEHLEVGGEIPLIDIGGVGQCIRINENRTIAHHLAQRGIIQPRLMAATGAVIGNDQRPRRSGRVVVTGQVQVITALQATGTERTQASFGHGIVAVIVEAAGDQQAHGQQSKVTEVAHYPESCSSGLHCSIAP
jgi:hypothetical protein